MEIKEDLWPPFLRGYQNERVVVRSTALLSSEPGAVGFKMVSGEHMAAEGVSLSETETLQKAMPLSLDCLPAVPSLR